MKKEKFREGMGNMNEMFSNYIEMTKESSNLFLDSLVTCYSKKAMFISAIIFLITLTMFAGSTPNVLISGDAVVYAQQIAHSDFSNRTIHLGYFLLGAVFTYLLPFSNDYALNLMNCFFGALSISIIYLIAFNIYGKHTVAVVSSLFLATNYLFVFNSLYAEVYVIQTFFLLLALQLWLLNKPIVTGLSFALSILVSPTTIFAIPCFIILRPHKQALFRLGVSLFIILAIVLLPRFDDYLYGGRGLLISANIPFNIRSTILKESFEIIYGMFLYIPFVLYGIIIVIRQKRLRVFGMGIFSLWLTTFLFADRFADVPAQLPFYALLCIIGGLGFQNFSTILSTKGNGKKGLIYVWLLSSISIIIIFVLAIGRTSQEVSIILPMIFFVIIALYTIIVTLLTRVNNIGKINHSLAVFGMLVLFVSINSSLLYTRVNIVNHDLVEYHDTVLEMSKVAGPDYLVVGRWGQGILFEHYVSKKSYTKYWINTEWLFTDSWGKSKQVESVKKWQDAIANGQEIWLLDDYPTLFSDLREGGYTIEPFRNIYYAKPPD